ncbi:MAG: hypothetical protein LKI39_10395 [Bacteroides sp.]|jgi:predicted RNase H-like HicB family nuclease|nr:hypothetical protein [Bacteroides sp.]MCI1682952.1 hypothetical protein [Bacteroides sp.]
MKLSKSDYAIEATADGGFYAYLKSNILCCAYGDSLEEACDNLAGIVDDFVSDMYMVEEFV